MLVLLYRIIHNFFWIEVITSERSIILRDSFNNYIALLFNYRCPKFSSQQLTWTYAWQHTKQHRTVYIATKYRVFLQRFISRPLTGYGFPLILILIGKNAIIYILFVLQFHIYNEKLTMHRVRLSPSYILFTTESCPYFSYKIVHYFN